MTLARVRQQGRRCSHSSTTVSGLGAFQEVLPVSAVWGLVAMPSAHREQHQGPACPGIASGAWEPAAPGRPGRQAGEAVFFQSVSTLLGAYASGP